MNSLQDDFDIRLDHYLHALTPAGGPGDSVYGSRDFIQERSKYITDYNRRVIVCQYAYSS